MGRKQRTHSVVALLVDDGFTRAGQVEQVVSYWIRSKLAQSSKAGQVDGRNNLGANVTEWLGRERKNRQC